MTYMHTARPGSGRGRWARHRSLARGVGLLALVLVAGPTRPAPTAPTTSCVIALTPLGRTLTEPIAALRRLAEEHLAEAAAAQRAYAERGA